MKVFKIIFSAICLTLTFFACQKSETTPVDNSGFVFTQSNDVDKNELLVYKRAENGILTVQNPILTGGKGADGLLGNCQGAVIMSSDKKFVLAVNAGSNSISTFKIASGSVSLVGSYSTAKSRPISIAENGKYVYVLCSEGVEATHRAWIEGFSIDSNGMLTPITGSAQDLGTGVNAAQVSFVRSDVLAVSERKTNKITTFVVNSSGIAGGKQSFSSQANQPFGFAVGSNGVIFVSEAAATASSMSTYAISATGAVSNVGTKNNGQGAACWTVLNNSQTYAYTTNAFSDNISAFKVNSNGMIDTHSIATTFDTKSGPVDASFDKDTKYMYVLVGFKHKLYSFSADATTGALTAVGITFNNLPAAGVGMASI